MVSPLELQAGARKIAEAEGIMHVELHQDSTPVKFSMQFLNKIFIGIHEVCHASDEVHVEQLRLCRKCGREFAVQKNELFCMACSADARERAFVHGRANQKHHAVQSHLASRGRQLP